MSPLTLSYACLALAIVMEVAGSSFLLRSEGFTRALPSTMVLLFYGVAFYLLSLALRQIPLGMAYAIWSGVGIVLTALIGTVVFRQSLDWPALIGIGFIVTGVVIMNSFSQVSGH